MNATDTNLSTTTEVVAYLIQSDDAGRGGWGSWIKVTVANTPEADAAAAKFFARACTYTVGEPYNVSQLGLDDEDTDPADLGPALNNYFFPTCEHGMNAHNCSGPMHFLSYEQERALGL